MRKSVIYLNISVNKLTNADTPATHNVIFAICFVCFVTAKFSLAIDCISALKSSVFFFLFDNFLLLVLLGLILTADFSCAVWYFHIHFKHHICKYGS